MRLYMPKNPNPLGLRLQIPGKRMEDRCFITSLQVTGWNKHLGTPRSLAPFQTPTSSYVVKVDRLNI